MLCMRGMHEVCSGRCFCGDASTVWLTAGVNVGCGDVAARQVRGGGGHAAVSQSTRRR